MILKLVAWIRTCDWCGLLSPSLAFGKSILKESTFLNAHDKRKEESTVARLLKQYGNQVARDVCHCPRIHKHTKTCI